MCRSDWKLQLHVQPKPDCYQYMQVPGTFAHVGFTYSPNCISKSHEAKKNASIASKVGSVYALGERSSVNQ